MRPAADFVIWGMKMPPVKVMLRWLPALLWMGLIFMLSHQPGSDSGNLTRMLMEFLAGLGLDLPQVFGKYATLALRKTAHFTEYLILFLWLKLAIGQTAKGLTRALIITIAYAITDEFHQLFIPGRVGNAGDVLVDSLGATLAWIFIRFRRKKAEKIE